MKIVFKIISFYFVIVVISISTFQFVSASNTEVSNNSNMVVCTDRSHLMEIYLICTDDYDKGFNENKINIAIKSLNDMIDECPQNEYYVRGIRASCFMKKNKPSKALSDYQFILSSSPSPSNIAASFIHHEIGLIYHQQERYEDAIQEFTIVIDKVSYSYQDYIYRARAYKGLGDREAALSDYREALRLSNERNNSQEKCKSCYSPGEVDIYLEMGDFLEQQGGDVQEAISLYEEGLKNNPGSLELQNKLKK
jgi:tetratricopeptide (TPR) repeat protein